MNKNINDFLKRECNDIEQLQNQHVKKLKIYITEINMKP